MGALYSWRFCPVCGEAIEKIEDRAECPACGYVGYANAVPGAEAVCFDERGRVLLGRRAFDLAGLERNFPKLYGKWGFRDSVNVGTGAVSNSYLALDQGMIMAAIGNALGDDVLRKAFASPSYERALRPVIGIEQFGASASP